MPGIGGNLPLKLKSGLFPLGCPWLNEFPPGVDRFTVYVLDDL
jgi:hypothetical protein